MLYFLHRKGTLSYNLKEWNIYVCSEEIVEQSNTFLYYDQCDNVPLIFCL